MQADPPKRRGRRQESAATSTAFRDELLRERARSDRTEQVFSVVMFEVPRSRVGNRLADELSRMVPARMRATDFMGWFDRTHLAVILDSCLVCSALSFGNEICRRIAEKMTPPRRMIVQTFPAHFARNHDLADGTRSLVRFPLDSGGSGRSEAGAADDIRHCAGGCPVVCLQKTGFLPGTITVDYKALPGIEMRPAITSKGLPLWKRGIDIVVSALGLVLLSPIILLTFLCLKLASKESAILTQERVGYLGRPFNMLKFRTMNGRDAGPMTHREAMRKLIQDEEAEEPMIPVKIEAERNATRLGRFLRKTDIDELPQLVNVLRGEMSLVGPRPPIPYEVEAYQRWHRGRLDAVPGMTGLWQVSGMNRLSFRQMARLDIYYSRNMSPWLDAKIIARTPIAVIGELLSGIGERKQKESAVERRPAEPGSGPAES